MPGIIKRIAGPAFIGSSATNIYAPPAATIYTVITHIHFANVTTGTVTFSLYLGGTGASVSGTELFKDQSVVAKSGFDFYPRDLYMASTDFLVGISAATSITITVMGYQAAV